MILLLQQVKFSSEEQRAIPDGRVDRFAAISISAAV
jgi:hypothetical protein